MKINNFGQVTISANEAFESLYSGKINNLNHIYIQEQDEIDLFNKSKLINADSFADLENITIPNCDIKEFHTNNQQNWLMPENYCPNLIEFLYSKCKTEQEINRVNTELELFEKYNMINLLFYLKYLVDTMRQNNIVWGVGRGSSVASYILYLIGVHKIDSLKYNLDIQEFLK